MIVNLVVWDSLLIVISDLFIFFIENMRVVNNVIIEFCLIVFLGKLCFEYQVGYMKVSRDKMGFAQNYYIIVSFCLGSIFFIDDFIVQKR